LGGQIKEDKMGGACGTQGSRRKFPTGSWWGNLKERCQMLSVGGI